MTIDSRPQTEHSADVENVASSKLPTWIFLQLSSVDGIQRESGESGESGLRA